LESPVSPGLKYLDSRDLTVIPEASPSRASYNIVSSENSDLGKKHLSQYIFNKDRIGLNQLHEHKTKTKLMKLQTTKMKSKILTILNKRNKDKENNKSDDESEKKVDDGLVGKIFDRFIQKDAPDMKNDIASVGSNGSYNRANMLIERGIHYVYREKKYYAFGFIFQFVAISLAALIIAQSFFVKTTTNVIK
jgi:hypothetical protein